MAPDPLAPAIDLAGPSRQPEFARAVHGQGLDPLRLMAQASDFRRVRHLLHALVDDVQQVQVAAKPLAPSRVVVAARIGLVGLQLLVGERMRRIAIEPDPRVVAGAHPDAATSVGQDRRVSRVLHLYDVEPRAPEAVEALVGACPYVAFAVLEDAEGQRTA